MLTKPLAIPTDDRIREQIQTLGKLLKITERQKPEKPVRRRFKKKYEKVKEHYLGVIDSLNASRELAKLSIKLNIELVEAILAEPVLRQENDELKTRLAEHDEMMNQIHQRFRELYKITRIAVRS